MPAKKANSKPSTFRKKVQNSNPPSITKFLSPSKKEIKEEEKKVGKGEIFQKMNDGQFENHSNPRKRMRLQEDKSSFEEEPGSPIPEPLAEIKMAKEADNNSNDDKNYEKMDNMPHLLGAHVSAAGGAYNALIEARKLGASSCAFFIRPPKSFHVKPMEDKVVEKWFALAKELQFNLDNIVVHAPYLLNIGSPNGEALERSRLILADDLNRCEKLNIKYYNIHPGSTLGEISTEKCCKAIAESINHALTKTKNVVVLLENMAGQGNWVGSNFKDLGLIISHIEDKSRIGVCLDTCHAFAYGYGLNTNSGLQRMISDFKKHVGLEYLKAMHINDSKGACGDHKDRHEDIGKGVIGKAGFKLIMKEEAFKGIPLILETPGGYYDREIKLLHDMAASK